MGKKDSDNQLPLATTQEIAHPSSDVDDSSDTLSVIDTSSEYEPCKDEVPLDEELACQNNSPLHSTPFLAPMDQCPSSDHSVGTDDQSQFPIRNSSASSVCDASEQVTQKVTDKSSSNRNLEMEIEDLKSQLSRKTTELIEKDKEITFLKDRLASCNEYHEKFRESIKLINMIRENDERTRFYTGLSTWGRFMIIFKLCEPAVAQISKSSTAQSKLSFQEQLLLTLMRLRLYLNVEDLAIRFQISQPTATRYISKWIDVMYVRLAMNFMVWPRRDELLLTMPMLFRKHFRRCVVIIDCFEVSCQPFTNFLDRCSTYSNCKSLATVKFLIGITPQGTISYISQGYRGRSSDVYKTDDSKHIAVVASDEKVIKNPLSGDVVLADRGFLISESVALMMAELITPAFKETRSQLTQLEIENSRRVSNVRIHVERVIGQLKRTYTILEKTLSIKELRSDEDGLAFLDKIVFVCCCLLNANEEVLLTA